MQSTITKETTKNLQQQQHQLVYNTALMAQFKTPISLCLPENGEG
jgi:hypothetical protein